MYIISLEIYPTVISPNLVWDYKSIRIISQLNNIKDILHFINILICILRKFCKLLSHFHLMELLTKAGQLFF